MTTATVHFEEVWLRDLVGLATPTDLVRCGVRAVVGGVEGPATIELAGADLYDLPELRRAFRVAADEVGAQLPRASEEREWRCRRLDIHERAGTPLVERSPEERFADLEFVVLEAMRRVEPASEGFIEIMVQQRLSAEARSERRAVHPRFRRARGRASE